MNSGRPRASSRETLAEAACELFLEQGYEETTIAEITARAGVSRSSFFNYFGSKADILWAGLDEKIAELAQALDGGEDPRSALHAVGEGFAPDSLALALVNATAMGLGEELERETGWRRARIATAVAARLRSDGADAVAAEIAGAALGGAVLAAVREWAHRGAGRVALSGILHAAVDLAATLMPAPVRQLRVVARADDFDRAVMFYRDALGMSEEASYEGDGGARVMILDAGRATLELSNAAQIELIDRIETDGDAPSDAVRIALEVRDAASVAERLADAGAQTEASARITPWNSLNARLRGPAGLQLTLFQELDRP